MDYWLYFMYIVRSLELQTNTVLSIFYLRQTAHSVVTQATSFYVNTFVDDVFTYRKLCCLTQVPNISKNNNDH